MSWSRMSDVLPVSDVLFEVPRVALGSKKISVLGIYALDR